MKFFNHSYEDSTFWKIFKVLIMANAKGNRTRIEGEARKTERPRKRGNENQIG